jgi:integrase
MRKPKLGSVYLRGSIYWIKYYRNGQPFRESSESEAYEEAERLLKRRQGEIVTGKFAGLTPERVRIGRLIDLVIEDYEDNGRRNLRDVKWRAERHLRPKLAEIRAADFGTNQIKRYVSDRRRAGAADATINRELAIIRRGFNLALHADPPMIARAPHIPKLQEENVRQGFLEHTQYLTLRGVLPDHLKAIFVVGYHVGVRSGELRKITWSQIDIAGKEIRLGGNQTKNKKPRTLPIYGEMPHWLEMQKAERDQLWPNSPWVFHYRGRPIGSHRKGWKDACERAGLPGLLFHDLRRSAVRNMERAGIPRNVAMGITGHRTENVYRRYDIVSRQDLTTAGEKMERYLADLAEVDAAATGTISGTVKEIVQ